MAIFNSYVKLPEGIAIFAHFGKFRMCRCIPVEAGRTRGGPGRRRSAYCRHSTGLMSSTSSLQAVWSKFLQPNLFMLWTVSRIRDLACPCGLHRLELRDEVSPLDSCLPSMWSRHSFLDMRTFMAVALRYYPPLRRLTNLAGQTKCFPR